MFRGRQGVGRWRIVGRVLYEDEHRLVTEMRAPTGTLCIMGRHILPGVTVLRRVRDTMQTLWQFTYRECHQVEWPEMFEHLREKVPPEPWVRRQVRE
jgi:hypothetical protein